MIWMSNYLDQFDEETLPSFAQCFLVCGDQVRFTPLGLKRYKARFERAGFDVRKITNADELERALQGSLHIDLAEAADWFERRHAGKNSLEHQLVRAVMKGDEAEGQRLTEKLRRRRRLGLRVISSSDDESLQLPGDNASPPRDA